MPSSSSRWNTTPESIKNENTLLKIGLLLAAVVWFVVNSFSYFKYSSLERNGSYTSGEIVRKVREIPDKTPHFFLNYKYKNTQANESCATTELRFTTPKDKACIVSIQSHRVTEEEYNTFQLGDSVEVLYLKSGEKTHSVLPEMTFNKKRLLIINAGLLVFIFLLCRRHLNYVF